MESRGSGFADLEKLRLDCRTDSARTYIGEAIKCYQSGAYRSAIVATWVAVVYDVVDKLEELSLSRDSNAEKKVDEYREIMDEKNLARALKFERNILQVAKNEFDLLSEIEVEDLERLHEDRHRCAHPAAMPSGKPYQPSAETARSHIRNAVDHLLSQEPLQGKEALEEIINKVTSEYFPTTEDEALERLKPGAITNARDSLVRNVVRVLLKGLLQDEREQEDWKRFVAALRAIRSVHPGTTEVTVRNKVPDIVESVDETETGRLIEFCRDISIGWEAIGEYTARVEQYVHQVPIEPSPDDPTVRRPLKRVHPDLLAAARVQGLQDVVEERMQEASYRAYSELAIEVDELDVDQLIQRFTESQSYMEAGELGGRVEEVVDDLQVEQLRELLDGIVKNDQIHNAAIAHDSVCVILERSCEHCDELKDSLNTVYRFLSEAGGGRAEIIAKNCPDLEAVQEAKKEAEEDELPF